MTIKRFIAKNGLDNNNLTISNVADPILPSDAATKNVTDSISALANTASANTVAIQNVNITQNNRLNLLESNTSTLFTNLSSANTFLQSNDALTLAASKSYTDSANLYLQTLIVNDGFATVTQLNAANTFLQSNDALTLVTAKSYTDSANTYLRANDALTLAASKSYTDSANLYLQTLIVNDGFATVTQLNAANTFLQSNDALTLVTAKSYTDSANTYLRANDALTLAASKSYTDSANTQLKGYVDTNINVINSVNNTQNNRLNLLESNTSTLQTDLIAANTFLKANDALTLVTAKGYTDVANTYLIANLSSANTFLQSNDALTLTASKSYTDNANNWLQANDVSTLTSAKSYTDNSNTQLKSYSDNKFLPFTGGTLSGPLTISTGGNTALFTSGPVSIVGDLSVQGNIILSGNSTTYNSNVAVITEPMLYLAGNNSADVVDIGIYGHFIGPGNSPYSHYQHTGLVRDYTDRKWKLFSNVAEPQVSNSWVDFSNAIYDTLKVGNIEASSANINGNDLITYIDTVNITQNNRLNLLESNTANLFVGLSGANTFLQSNDALTLSTSKNYTDNANTQLKGYVDTNINVINSVNNTQNNRLNLLESNTSTLFTNLSSANTFLQSNDALTLVTAKGYTDVANTFLQSNDALTLVNAKSYTDVANTYLTSNLNTANTFLQSNDALTLSSAKSYSDLQLSSNVIIINSVNNTQNSDIRNVSNIANIAYATANVGNKFVFYGGNIGGSVNAGGDIVTTSGQIYQNNISMLAMSLIFGG